MALAVLGLGIQALVAAFVRDMMAHLWILVMGNLDPMVDPRERMVLTYQPDLELGH